MTKPRTRPQGLTSKPSQADDRLDDLFTAEQMLRACEVVRDGIQAYVDGESSAVRVPLRQHLMQPIEAFMARERAKCVFHAIADSVPR